MSQLNEHESVCGARTEACEKCGNYVTKRDFVRHISADCNFPKRPCSPEPFKMDVANLYNTLADEQLMENFCNDFIRSEAQTVAGSDFLLQDILSPLDQPNNTRGRTWSGRGTVPVVDNIHKILDIKVAAREKNVRHIPTVEASAYFGKHIQDDIKNLLSGESLSYLVRYCC